MSTYYAILTAVGEAKLANATALGTKLQLSVMAVGDGNGALPTPVRTQTALVRETYRAELNNLSVDPLNPSQIIAELVIPETEGGYWLREMCIYDAAGDMFAVANCPPSYKPQMAEGSGRTQVLRMVLIVSSTAAVQLRIDPSIVLATRAFAESLITVHMEAADPHKQYQLRGGFTNLNVNTQLTAAHEGVLLLSAEGASRTYTLPATNAALGVREFVLRRTDATTNTLVVAASDADKIMLDTTAQAEGQSTTELLFAGDYLRLRSDGAGKWWCVGQAKLPGSIATGLVAFSSAGVRSLSVPAVLRSGRRVPKVTVVGAGGAGGVDSAVNAGGGSGGGAALRRVNLAGFSTVPVTVGAGGVGRSTTGAGGNGGASSFGSYCSASGGGGGQQNGTAGTGGAGNGGDINILGGYGFNRVEAASALRSGGGGGASIFGNGTSGAGNSSNGRSPGSGSGGALTSSGNGADGIVIIEW